MQLRNGDILRRSGFPTYHSGVYVGPSGPYGEDVVHSDKGASVRLVRLSEFAADQPVEVVSRPRSPHEGWVIRERALRLIGTPYDLVNFNCEHLVNYAHTGVPFSPTVRGAVAVGIIGLILLAASRN